MIVNATLTAPTDYLADATRTYLEALEESRVRFAFADSAFSVLQREIQRTSDPGARQLALRELTMASTSTTQIVTHATKHSDYISELVDAPGPAMGWQTFKASHVFFAHANEDASMRVHIERIIATPTSGLTSEIYWRRIRDELQAYFNVNLHDLQSLVGIAYPTLVNLGKRKPHPSTSRAVLQLHTLASHALRSRGDGPGREWLASVGRRTLERGGIEAFRTASIDEPVQVAAIGGIRFKEEPPVGPAAVPEETRFRGDRF
ncbi:MAG: hypothetical protein ACREM6_11845 [Vulcanimicrobiaceae bacterium]